jgi:hypothetical protein
MAIKEGYSNTREKVGGLEGRFASSDQAPGVANKPRHENESAERLKDSVDSAGGTGDMVGRRAVMEPDQRCCCTLGREVSTPWRR